MIIHLLLQNQPQGLELTLFLSLLPPPHKNHMDLQNDPNRKSPTFRCIGAPSLVVPPERTSGGPWAATTVPQVGEAEQDEAEGVAVGEQRSTVHWS